MIKRGLSKFKLRKFSEIVHKIDPVRNQYPVLPTFRRISLDGKEIYGG